MGPSEVTPHPPMGVCHEWVGFLLSRTVIEDSGLVHFLRPILANCAVILISPHYGGPQKARIMCHILCTPRRPGLGGWVGALVGQWVGRWVQSPFPRYLKSLGHG